MSIATAPHADWRAAPPEYAGVPSDQKRVKTYRSPPCACGDTSTGNDSWR